ncbi:hypothetical protein DIPPA_63526 [Diplonema papillatum]|nr:hypothetical protein DIPPA_63526 [Diplonema papillatum]
MEFCVRALFLFHSSSLTMFLVLLRWLTYNKLLLFCALVVYRVVAELFKKWTSRQKVLQTTIATCSGSHGKSLFIGLVAYFSLRVTLLIASFVRFWMNTFPLRMCRIVVGSLT